MGRAGDEIYCHVLSLVRVEGSQVSVRSSTMLWRYIRVYYWAIKLKAQSSFPRKNYDVSGESRLIFFRGSLATSPVARGAQSIM